MKRALLFALGAILALSIGCIDYDEFLKLNKDGSGHIRMRMAIEKATYEMLQGMAESFGEGEAPMGATDKQRIEKVLKERKSNAKLEKYVEKDEGDDRVWEMEFSFQNTNDLVDIGYALDESQTSDDEVPFSFEKQADGTWLYRRTLDTDESGGDMSGGPTIGMGDASGVGDAPGTGGMPQILGEEIDPDNFNAEEFAAQLQEQMGEMMKSMEDLQKTMEEQEARMEAESKDRYVRFTVEFPGDVIESNATRVDGKKAIWEYPLDEIQSMGDEAPELRAVSK